MEPINRYKIEIEQVWIEDDGTIDYDNAINDEYYQFVEYVINNADEAGELMDFTKKDIQDGIDHVNKFGTPYEYQILVDGEGLWNILTIRPVAH